jgi:hypothetical protein
MTPQEVMPVMRCHTVRGRLTGSGCNRDEGSCWLSLVVGLGGLEPPPSSLSEIDGRPPCYPAFLLVVRLRKSYKDGVNSLSAAERQAVRGRVWPRSPGPAVDEAGLPWTGWTKAAIQVKAQGEGPPWEAGQLQEHACLRSVPVAASRHLGDSFQAASSLDGIYQEVGFSGWYSQTWKKWSRSMPLSRSARAMNWAVVTLP